MNELIVVFNSDILDLTNEIYMSFISMLKQSLLLKYHQMGKNHIMVLIKKMNEIILIDWKFSQERMGEISQSQCTCPQ